MGDKNYFVYCSHGDCIRLQKIGPAFLYTALMFSMMLAMVLWPGQGDKLLVIVADSSAHSADHRLYNMLEHTEAKILNKLSGNRFIVTGPESDLASILYNRGALLVIKADPTLWCGWEDSTLNEAPFRRI